MAEDCYDLIDQAWEAIELYAEAKQDGSLEESTNKVHHEACVNMVLYALRDYSPHDHGGVS